MDGYLSLLNFGFLNNLFYDENMSISLFHAVPIHLQCLNQ